MSDFLRFLNETCKNFPLHVEITYNKTCDWMIYIYKQGCAKDYPNSEKTGDDAIVVLAQSCDMELCFARAHVALKEWLCDNVGGY